MIHSPRDPPRESDIFRLFEGCLVYNRNKEILRTPYIMELAVCNTSYQLRTGTVKQINRRFS